MSRLALIFAILALAVYCLIECIRTDRRQVRYLPKALWLLLILIPVVGPGAWLLAGRPRSAGSPPPKDQPPTVPRRPRGPPAPDDDPDFLAQLDEKRRMAARDDESRPQDKPAGTDEDPESSRDSGS